MQLLAPPCFPRWHADGEPVEITAIRTNINLITDAVTVGDNLQWFANSLVEKAFIARGAAQGILNTQGIAPATKANKLLDSVFAVLRGSDRKRHWFDTFIGIFCSEAAHAELVQKLKGGIDGQEKRNGTRSTDFVRFSKPELIDLLEIVGVDVQTEWRSIGLGLELKQPELNAIQMANRGSLHPDLDCITQVFTRWHDGATSEYSWKKLAEVLCSRVVGREGLLEDMHAKLSNK